MVKKNDTPKAAKPKKAENGHGGGAGVVLYPTIQWREDPTITVEFAKELLGWEEEQLPSSDNPQGTQFGIDYLLEDRHGKKIRCKNNVRNRPLYWQNMESLIQDHLNKRFAPKGPNGEPVIIGRTGIVLNGQHCLVSVILAEQDRLKDAEGDGEWATNWPGPVTMSKLVVFGIDESDETVNTMDTCKPRSIADVIYRSPYFASKGPKVRKQVARICDYAIRTLWSRTQANKDPWAPRRTTAEALDFLGRHQKLLDCVEHIFKEEQEKSISGYISLGTAAGLMYLMGCSASDEEEDDPKGYYETGRKEKALNWDNWETACGFFTALSKPTADFQEVKYAIKGLGDPDAGTSGSVAERTAVLVRAWLAYLSGEKWPNKDQVSIEDCYKVNQDGVKIFKEMPVIGGIDKGPAKGKGAATAEGDEEGEEGEGEESVVEHTSSGNGVAQEGLTEEGKKAQAEEQRKKKVAETQARIEEIRKKKQAQAQGEAAGK